MSWAMNCPNNGHTAATRESAASEPRSHDPPGPVLGEEPVGLSDRIGVAARGNNHASLDPHHQVAVL
jgi:hypothetical protein